MIMQRTIDKTFNNMINKCLVIYFDDIIIYSKEHEEYRRNVRKSFQILELNKIQ